MAHHDRTIEVTNSNGRTQFFTVSAIETATLLNSPEDTTVFGVDIQGEGASLSVNFTTAVAAAAFYASVREAVENL